MAKSIFEKVAEFCNSLQGTQSFEDLAQDLIRQSYERSKWGWCTYSYKDPCPKCGGKVSVSYDKKADMLDAFCSGCGYEWKIDPLDKEE